MLTFSAGWWLALIQKVPKPTSSCWRPDMNSFRVGFSNDFLDKHGRLVFPDIGLALLDQAPGLTYDFMTEYRGEYVPEQLHDYDVVVSLKPRA